MSFWETVFDILTLKMARPRLFGFFHILCIVLSVAAGICLVRKFRNPTRQQVNRVLIAVSVACIVLELYKQFFYCCNIKDSQFVFRYKWFIFPFQFCSTPMYVGLLAGIVKNRRFHDACCAYLSSYAVFGGLSVMVYPAQVFSEVIGFNIQTMFCHGSMIAVGIFLMCTKYVNPDFTVLRRALPLFTTGCVMAMIMNKIAYVSGILQTHHFNMFYISPYDESILPTFESLKATLPTPVPQLIYFGAFTLIALLIILGFKEINELTEKHRKKLMEALTLSSDTASQPIPTQQNS